MQPFERPQDSGFALGLLIGACAGAGVVLWLAPRMTAELRQRATASAKDLGQRASAHYQQAGARVADAAGDSA